MNAWSFRDGGDIELQIRYCAMRSSSAASNKINSSPSFPLLPQHLILDPPLASRAKSRNSEIGESRALINAGANRNFRGGFRKGTSLRSIFRRWRFPSAPREYLRRTSRAVYRHFYLTTHRVAHRRASSGKTERRDGIQIPQGARFHISSLGNKEKSTARPLNHSDPVNSRVARGTHRRNEP